MTTITNIFYPLIHLKNHIPSEEEFYEQTKELCDEDMNQDYVIYGLTSGLYRPNSFSTRRWITSHDMDLLLDYLSEFRVFSDLFPELDDRLSIVRANRVTVSEDHVEATEKQMELVSILSDYANLVLASSRAADHGKSWEPLVNIMMNQDGDYQVYLRSYQAGDEFDTGGNLDEVVDSVRDHVESVQKILLRGSTNSNPFVMEMIGDNSDDAESFYRTFTEKYPMQYSQTLLRDGVFLPSVFPGCWVESSGDPEAVYNPAHVIIDDGLGGGDVPMILGLTVGYRQLM